MRKIFDKWIIYILLSLIAIPFLIMYIAFFAQAFSKGISLGIIPQKLSFSNFSFLWSTIPWGLEKTRIWGIFLNTFLFASISGLTVTVVCTLTGYALSRIEFRGKAFFLSMQLILHAVSGQILLIAIFFLLLYTKLLYKIPGVALARASLEIPLGVWMAKGFFDTVPWDIERSAMIDGCNRFQVWYKIFLPLIKPGIGALFIWGFLFAWHDFIYVYTLLPGTVPLLSTLVQGLLATEVVDYGVIAAISLFYMLPPLFLFVFLQKALMKAPIMGGKGIA
ncbi:MAG TPA: carbohydrate ABC transporter permease [Candidatus Atribacteria bacterium]|nr:MAG: carbohydrate ABC transporter permease [Candidatus Nealsonbacteria bacterium]HDK27499.1 carbohydrate ABC transporter permease [Candidatus Atribacteria bacterium]